MGYIWEKNFIKAPEPQQEPPVLSPETPETPETPRLRPRTLFVSPHNSVKPITSIHRQDTEVTHTQDDLALLPKFCHRCKY